VIFIVYLPPVIALSNYQNPVSDLNITNIPSGSTDYTLNLSWSRPVASEKMEPNPALFNPSYTERATNYKVYYRNATKAGQAALLIDDPSLNNNTGQNISITHDLALERGSMYVFRVAPSHVHTYINSDGTDYKKDAPMDNSMPESTAAYLTDIFIEAQGSGNKLTVTWDSPVLDGKEIFNGYRIYYTLAGSKIMEIPGTPFSYIPADSKDLIRYGGKLKYTIEDNNLKIGKFYAVKVEPMIDDKVVRQQKDPMYISVGGVEYKLYFRNWRTNEYRTNDAYISPSLAVLPDGQNYVKILWESIQTSIQNIESVEIFCADDAKMSLSKRLIGSLSGSAARNVNFWQAIRPDRVTYYQILIKYRESNNSPVEMYSEIAWFDPAYNEFTPYKPTILKLTDDGNTPPVMNVTWQAFLREAYNDAELAFIDKDYGNLYVDRNVYYDIYVTDDIRNFDNPLFNDKAIVTVNASADNVILKPYPSQNKMYPSFSVNLTEYYTKSPDGAVIRQTLKDNTVYYVKIAAVRDPGGQKSKPAVASHYITVSGAIATNPLMMTKPPLRVKTDASGIEWITQDTITMEWDTVYYEAYNNDDKSWYSLIGVNAAGNIVFGEDAEKLMDSNRILRLYETQYRGGEDSIRRALASLGVDADTLPIRLINLPTSSDTNELNTQYEIHTVSYETVLDAGGYDKYMQKLLASDADKYWTTIQPTGKAPRLEFEVTQEDYPKTGALLRNTAYLIYFRPYFMLEEKKTAFYPTYLLATTQDVYPPINIVPIVPNLEEAGHTDTNITIRWRYTPNLTYEIMYAENLDNPDKGILIPWETIIENGGLRTEDGTVYMYCTIPDLFPYMYYEIWIRAIADNTTAFAATFADTKDDNRLISAWSNPINVKTDDIPPPKPPYGLGVADMEHVNIYNRENDLKLTPVGETYLIMEWMREKNDTSAEEIVASQEGATINTERAEYLPHPGLGEMMMVMFKELSPNRQYYIRAKTTLTMTKINGITNREFSYTIQLSESSEFLESIEIIVPPLPLGTDAPYFRQHDSEWSAVVHYYTAHSESEYDGEDNPLLYPLPDRDYEIIYNKETSNLTFRFRTDKIDRRGNHDNQVDQRFVSRLIQKKIYVYTVDLSRHFYLPVKSRTLDLPYSILTAFEERKISLKLTAGNLSVTFEPGALRTETRLATNDFGLNSHVLISLSEPLEAPRLGNKQNYAVKPQKLEIMLSTPMGKTRLKDTIKPILIELRPDYPLFQYPSHIGAYVFDIDTNGWDMMDYVQSADSNTLSAKMKHIATYAAIASDAPAVAPNNGGRISDPVLRRAMAYVTKQVRITDLDMLLPESIVSESQINQLICAIALKKSEIQLQAALDAADESELRKSDLLVVSSPVTRQEGLAAMVRLYELKTGRPVGDYKTLEQTPFEDIKLADEQYREDLLKAAHIGMLNFINEWRSGYESSESFNQIYTFNPKSYMTMGELFLSMNMVIRSAGKI
jgi:hypothetical protein